MTTQVNMLLTFSMIIKKNIRNTWLQVVGINFKKSDSNRLRPNN